MKNSRPEIGTPSINQVMVGSGTPCASQLNWADSPSDVLTFSGLLPSFQYGGAKPKSNKFLQGQGLLGDYRKGFESGTPCLGSSKKLSSGISSPENLIKGTCKSVHFSAFRQLAMIVKGQIFYIKYWLIKRGKDKNS
jgi:hypothetical protein